MDSNATATSASRPAGTPVLARAVVVLDDDVVPLPVNPVATPLVERFTVESVSFPVVDVARRLADVEVFRAVPVTDAEVPGRVAVVGRTVPLGRGRVELAVVGPVVTVGVVVGGGTVTKLFTIWASQVTREPAAAEPLHWLIVIGNAAVTVEGSTVQVTRREAPPPLAEPLHWVMSALVVLATGEQFVVGSAPPPVPEPMHWSTVAGDFVPLPVIVLVISTEHFKVAPPLRADPLHWVTVVDRATTGVVVHSGSAPAAPWHSTIVPLELLTPVAKLTTLLMMTWHSTAIPPVL